MRDILYVHIHKHTQVENDGNGAMRLDDMSRGSEKRVSVGVSAGTVTMGGSVTVV